VAALGGSTRQILGLIARTSNLDVRETLQGHMGENLPLFSRSGCVHLDPPNTDADRPRQDSPALRALCEEETTHGSLHACMNAASVGCRGRGNLPVSQVMPVAGPVVALP
jgi:hypothetical protein